MKNMSNLNEEKFDAKTLKQKKFIYSLCFFHAIAQNRKKFGPIGWNIPYQFTKEDLSVSLTQVEESLNEYKVIPYKVINFICSEINYGGRVTDDKDLRLTKSLLRNYLNQ